MYSQLMRECVWERMSVWVSWWVSVSMCVREDECVCVCVWERENECVRECVCELMSECVSWVCLCERVSWWVSVWACVCERMSVRVSWWVCVHVCERESELLVLVRHSRTVVGFSLWGFKRAILRLLILFYECPKADLHASKVKKLFGFPKK